jgi:hypothetical protein
MRALVLGVLAGTGLAGCRLVPSTTPVPVERLPVGVEVTTAPAAMRLELSNGSTLRVMLAVNGGPARAIPAGGEANLGVVDLGPVPWSAVLTTGSGRTLLTLAVRPGDVAVENAGGGGSSSRGVGVRADLSCGRIDLWSGPPMMGPAPPPSFEPGDCDP